MSQQEHREKVRACRPAPTHVGDAMEGGGANDGTKEARGVLCRISGEERANLDAER